MLTFTKSRSDENLDLLGSRRSGFESETTINKNNIVLKEINEIAGPNNIALQGNFWIYHEKKNKVTMIKT